MAFWKTSSLCTMFGANHTDNVAVHCTLQPQPANVIINPVQEQNCTLRSAPALRTAQRPPSRAAQSPGL